MSDRLAARAVQSASIEAVVVRADGTREALGEIAYWHRNPLRRWARNFRRRMTTRSN